MNIDTFLKLAKQVENLPCNPDTKIIFTNQCSNCECTNVMPVVYDVEYSPMNDTVKIELE